MGDRKMANAVNRPTVEAASKGISLPSIREALGGSPKAQHEQERGAEAEATRLELSSTLPDEPPRATEIPSASAKYPEARWSPLCSIGRYGLSDASPMQEVREPMKRPQSTVDGMPDENQRHFDQDNPFKRSRTSFAGFLSEQAPIPQLPSRSILFGGPPPQGTAFSGPSSAFFPNLRPNDEQRTLPARLDDKYGGSGSSSATNADPVPTDSNALQEYSVKIKSEEEDEDEDELSTSTSQTSTSRPNIIDVFSKKERPLWTDVQRAEMNKLQQRVDNLARGVFGEEIDVIETVSSFLALDGKQKIALQAFQARVDKLQFPKMTKNVRKEYRKAKDEARTTNFGASGQASFGAVHPSRLAVSGPFLPI